MVCEVKNTSAWVDAPTVSPKTITTMSIKEVLAVSANLRVTPLSFKIFPKNSIPSNGRAPGEIKVVSNNPIMGNITFSSFETERGGFMRMSRSRFEVNNLIIGG